MKAERVVEWTLTSRLPSSVITMPWPQHTPVHTVFWSKSQTPLNFVCSYCSICSSKVSAFFWKVLFTYLRESELEEGQRTWSRLWAERRAQSGAWSHDLRSWSELKPRAGHLTDWAAQAPHLSWFLWRSKPTVLPGTAVLVQRGSLKGTLYECHHFHVLFA